MALRLPRIRAVWPPRPATKALLRRLGRQAGDLVLDELHRRGDAGRPTPGPSQSQQPPRPPQQQPRSTRQPQDQGTGPQVGYTPRADGRPDPGEVVWAWVPYEEDASRGKDRPVLVIGTDGADLLALQLTSKDHDRDAAQERRSGREWMDVGTGAWDSQRRPSEVRLDRLLRLRDDDVRREGAALPRVTFDAVLEAAGPHLGLGRQS